MKKIILIILSIIVLIGVLFFTGVFSKSDNIVSVNVGDVIKTTIIETVTGTGKVQPEVEVKISSEVSGEIIRLHIKEGDVVEKGDLLVVINPDIYESGVDRMDAVVATSIAGLKQAEAQLKEAKANFERNEKLIKKGVISSSEWDKVVSAYEIAKAAQNSAYHNVESSKASLMETQRNLLRTTIYSPSYGTISRLNVELGERVLGTQQMAGTEILRLADLSKMEVEVDINENDIVKVKEGDKVIINVDAYLKKEFLGRVSSISNSASNEKVTSDQVTTFKVKIKMLEESYSDLINSSVSNYSPFRPGMTAAVDIITNKKENVIGVPISSVVMRNAPVSDESIEEASGSMKEAVFVLEGDIARLRFVETGIQDDQNIEVLDGLNQGDKIITGPYTLVSKTLKDGDKVVEENK